MMGHLHLTTEEGIPSKSHVYIKPHKLLQTSIAHYTFMVTSILAAQSPSLTLVPDVAGCIVLREKEHTFTSTFWGATTKCVDVTADDMLTFQFFIEFLPAGAFHFFHHTQVSYLDQKVALENIDLQLSQNIQQAYESSLTVQQFVDALDHVFLAKWHNPSTCIPYMQKLLTQGNAIPQIVDTIGYSRRHLQRMFLEEIGCSMKHYQRISRINQAVQHLQNKTDSIVQIAHLCGYYDEAHFIHDFKEVMLLTPRQYQMQMSIFYNELFKF